MKAWIIETTSGIDSLKLIEREAPKPGPGQVLVRVRAASLNYRDLLVVEGRYEPGQRLPLIPVSDGAGEVAAVGEGVTRVRVGDRVVGAYIQRWLGGRPTPATMLGSTLGSPRDGVLAEYALFDEEGSLRIPDHLSFEEAATLPIAGVTAWNALFEGTSLKSGDTVLVQGTGGVAVFAIQLARAAGLRVIATSSSNAKLARARELGAHEGINYVEVPDWDRRAVELTGGVGVDLVVDVAGTTLSRSIGALRLGGQVSVVGLLGGSTAELDVIPLFVKRPRIQGIYVGSRDHFEELNRALTQHRLRPVIDRTYAFEEARSALATLKSGSHFGKLVIKGV